MAKPIGNPIDWPPIKTAYVTGTMSMRELAEMFGQESPSAIMQRAAKEGWAAERARLEAERTNAAIQAVQTRKKKELLDFNEDDLKVAKAIRSKAARLLIGPNITINDLRALASTMESAQRIGRIALGASSNITELTGKDGGPIQTERSPDEVSRAIQSKLDLLAAKGTPGEVPSKPES